MMLRLALLNLTEEVQQHVNSGAIGTQAAVQIAALTPGNQAAVMKKWAKGAFAGDNELVHFAYALKQQGQTFVLLVEDMTPEEREERQRERTETRNKIDRIERILGLLEELGKADPLKLAVALEGEVGKRMDQMDRVADAISKARWNLRQAKAHAEAREIARLNPDAEHESLTTKAPAKTTQAKPAAPKPGPKPKAPAKKATAERADPRPHAPKRQGPATAKKTAAKPAKPTAV
ncbi:hypothetical protein ACIQFZ_31975 [Streptomyces sp. NPDC093064]|uniref:hypothetical protein n=1 Tax=unclassified Streptomyces TaxID=2593676 RepID=UPI00368A0371